MAKSPQSPLVQDNRGKWPTQEWTRAPMEQNIHIIQDYPAPQDVKN